MIDGPGTKGACFVDTSQDFCLPRGETQQEELFYILPLEDFGPCSLRRIPLPFFNFPSPVISPISTLYPRNSSPLAFADVMTEGPGHVVHEETFRVSRHTATFTHASSQTTW